MTSKQSSWRPVLHQYLPLDWVEHFINGKLELEKLTEGEKEGIKADVASRRKLRDEPLCYAPDGHYKDDRRRTKVKFD